MKIVFTNHAKRKFVDLGRQGVAIAEKDVFGAIEDPEHVDEVSDAPKLIASRLIDKAHILRVVYKLENDIITVITFYPAQKGRYYEN